MRTDIKEANFLGPNEEFVVSGSDDGRLFIWERATGNIVFTAVADADILNCVQPHPYDFMLASSGIEHTVRIWEPRGNQPASLAGLTAIVEGNMEQMLEDDDGGGFGGASASTIQYFMSQLAQQESGGNAELPGECANQ